jgi:hypothetical protein
MDFPFERERTSTGRLKMALGIGMSPVKVQRFLIVREAESIAMISSRAVPIQTVAPSAERSALVATGMAICARRIWLVLEKTSTRFMARLARKTCLCEAS